MKLSVVMPAYNEEKRIGASLEQVEQYLQKRKMSAEIVVVNDGSVDGTEDVVKRVNARYHNIKLISLPINSGKGRAVKVGVLAAEGELILFTDSDLSAPIEELDKLLFFLKDDVKIVIGSRGLRESSLEIRQPFYREFMGRTFNKFVQVVLLPGIRDTQCGFKLFAALEAKAVFSELTIDGFGFDPEVLYLARKKGYKVLEVPVRWMHAGQSRVHIVRDSLKMLVSLFYIRWKH